MLKNIIAGSLIIIGTQTAMALNLDDVNNATNNINEASSTTQQASDKMETLNKDSALDMGKQVASDSAKGGVNGAVEGATSGSVVDGGTKGAIDGAKSSLNKL